MNWYTVAWCLPNTASVLNYNKLPRYVYFKKSSNICLSLLEIYARIVAYMFIDRSKAVLLLWIMFVICVSCLSYCLVYSL